MVPEGAGATVSLGAMTPAPGGGGASVAPGGGTELVVSVWLQAVTAINVRPNAARSWILRVIHGPFLLSPPGAHHEVHGREVNAAAVKASFTP